MVNLGTSRGGEAVKSLISKRSVVIAGRKTSLSLEDEFWNSLKDIAVERSVTVAALVAEIQQIISACSLSFAIRSERATCGAVGVGRLARPE
jgi:predicted DNA-binding ribbon-helix-helix protein